jgi:hypothetical protein
MTTSWERVLVTLATGLATMRVRPSATWEAQTRKAGPSALVELTVKYAVGSRPSGPLRVKPVMTTGSLGE